MRSTVNAWLFRRLLTPQAAGVSGIDVYIIPHHMSADQIRLLVQHLRVSTGHRRSHRHDDPPPNQGIPKHQLRERHFHQSVQPDGLADGMGILHDVPLADLDAVRVRRRGACCRGDARCGAKRAARDHLEQLELRIPRVHLFDQPRAVRDRH